MQKKSGHFLDLTNKSFIISLLFLIINNCDIYCQNVDTQIFKTIKFEIDGDEEDGFELTSETTINLIYLTKRSTRKNKYHFYESFYNPITEFRGKFRLENYRKDDLTEFKPELEDVFITTDKDYGLVLPHNIVPGENFEYNFTREYSGVEYLPLIPIENDHYYKNLKIIVEKDDDIDVEFKIFFTRDSLKYTKYINSSDECVLVFNDIKKIKETKYLRYPDVHAFIFIVPSYKNKIITPSTSETYKNWYGSLTDLTPELGERALSKIPAEIKSAKTDLEKIELIHKFVTKNFRYVSEAENKYAFIPKHPNKILYNMYGDCKERAALISAIAASEKIKIDMVFVPRDQAPKTDYINSIMFNHVICGYASPDGYKYFDPTAAYTPFESLPESIEGKKVLILDEKNPRFDFVRSQIKKPTIEIEIFTNLDSLKFSRAIIKYRRDKFSVVNKALNELTGEELENILLNFTNQYFSKISFEKFKLIEAEKNEIELSSRVDLSSFFIPSKQKFYVPVTPFSLYSNDIIERENDNYPIFLSGRNSLLLTIHIDSSGYSGRSKKYMLADSSNSANFLTELTNRENSIKIKYKFNQLEKLYADKDKTDFIEFYKKYLKLKKELFILKED